MSLIHKHLLIAALVIGSAFTPATCNDQQQEFAMDRAWINSTDNQRSNMPIEYKANAVGMSPEEFEFMARVIEAESDRSDDITGRIYIAAVILNRVNDNRFPNTVTGVLCEPIQFETVRGGSCSIRSTDLSEWAIVEAQRRLTVGSVPDNLLFFNCVGYNYGSPFGYIGGNYFMTYG